MKNVEEMKKFLFDEFLDKDLTIILEGSIQTTFVIHNAKILVNDYRIIITDSKKEEIIIKLDEVLSIKVESYVQLNMATQKIIIDC